VGCSLGSGVSSSVVPLIKIEGCNIGSGESSFTVHLIKTNSAMNMLT
jgi:hypothetical protein